MRRYCYMTLLISIILLVNCSINNPEVNIGKEYFLGNWRSNAFPERIEFTATNAKWFINYKKDTSIQFDSKLIDSSLYDSYDSTYLIMYYKGWDLFTDVNEIHFLDTFTESSGKIGWSESKIKYSILSENSFYFKGIDSDSILFIRN